MKVFVLILIMISIVWCQEEEAPISSSDADYSALGSMFASLFTHAANMVTQLNDKLDTLIATVNYLATKDSKGASALPGHIEKSLFEEVIITTTTEAGATTKTTTLPHDEVECWDCDSCDAWYNLGDREDQVRRIKVYGAAGGSIQALCNYMTDGGWMVIFQRSVENGAGDTDDFDKDFDTYENGIGTVCEKCGFWYRMDYVHRLTEVGKWTLRIIVKDSGPDGAIKHVDYTDFKLDSHNEKFKIHIGSASGPLGNILRCQMEARVYSEALRGHNIPTPAVFLTSLVNIGKGTLKVSVETDSLEFQTTDESVDKTTNCYDTLKGGWWYAPKSLSADFSVSYSPISFLPKQNLNFALPNFNQNFCTMAAFTAKEPYYIQCNASDPFLVSGQTVRKNYVAKVQMLIRRVE